MCQDPCVSMNNKCYLRAGVSFAISPPIFPLSCFNIYEIWSFPFRRLPALGSFVFWNAFLNTRFPIWNLLTLIFFLYALVILCWWAVIRVLARSLSSSAILRSWARILSLFSWSWNRHHVVRITTSVGIIASTPNTKEYGVWPVATLEVVLSTHRTKGSSSAHLPYFI